MFTTRQVLDQLAEANPGSEVTEDRVRHSIRRGVVARPMSVAGRFVWTPSEVAKLARALGLEAPAPAGALEFQLDTGADRRDPDNVPTEERSDG